MADPSFEEQTKIITENLENACTNGYAASVFNRAAMHVIADMQDSGALPSLDQRWHAYNVVIRWRRANQGKYYP